MPETFAGDKTKIVRREMLSPEVSRLVITFKDTAFVRFELNLSPTGEGDMESTSFALLDLVQDCFHSSLRKKEAQTERYLAALRNPDTQILGHPRGRIYNFCLGLNADWPRVFAIAAELDKAVEIDSYPDRQDLSLDLIRMAKKAGCRISIGTDSHGPSQLRFIEFGLAVARLGGIDPPPDPEFYESRRTAELERKRS